MENISKLTVDFHFVVGGSIEGMAVAPPCDSKGVALTYAVHSDLRLQSKS